MTVNENKSCDAEVEPSRLLWHMIWDLPHTFDRIWHPNGCAELVKVGTMTNRPSVQKELTSWSMYFIFRVKDLGDQFGVCVFLDRGFLPWGMIFFHWLWPLRRVGWHIRVALEWSFWPLLTPCFLFFFLGEMSCYWTSFPRPIFDVAKDCRIWAGPGECQLPRGGGLEGSLISHDLWGEKEGIPNEPLGRLEAAKRIKWIGICVEQPKSSENMDWDVNS